MAEDRKRRYTSYGNVAYQPEYEEPSRRREPEQPRRPRVQPRERVAVRPKVQVRQQGAVSLFAVVGFTAVIAVVFLLLSTGIQLAVVADETFDLQDQLAELKEEEKKLQAEYELVYDLSKIEEQMTTSGAMVRAGAANTVYLDLAETDSVVYFEDAASGIAGVVDRIEQMIHDFLS